MYANDRNAADASNKIITWLLGYGGMSVTRAENSYHGPTLESAYVLAQVSAINPSFLLFNASTACHNGLHGAEVWEKKRTMTVITIAYSVSGACQLLFWSHRTYGDDAHLVKITDQVETDDRLASEC